MGRHSAPESAEDTKIPVRTLPSGVSDDVRAAEAESNHYLLRCAWDLLNVDGKLDLKHNPEYARGQIELIADYLGFDRENVPGLLRVTYNMDAEALDWLLRLLQDGRR